MTHIEQTVTVTSDNNVITNVAGSLIQTDLVIQQVANPTFARPQLDHVMPPRYVSPRLTPQLSEQVRRERLLVFGGDLGTDKTNLARHVAWYMLEQMCSSAANVPGTITVQEWTRQEDTLLNLDLVFQEYTTSTIFVLTHLTPQDVRYDLSRLQRDAMQYQHYIIASTDTPLAAWKLPETANSYWPQLSAAQLYSSDQLATVLVQRLEENYEALPVEMQAHTFDLDQPLFGAWMLRDAAVQLKTPEQIAVFVQLLCAHKPPLTEDALRGLAALAQDNERVIQQWFHALLAPREQMLALGLSLFDGCFDDQFFNAFERLVERVWRRREPSLRGVDYCDLDHLRSFFNLVNVEAYGTLIESRLPRLRMITLSVVWNSHRRQVLAALPVLSELVEQSVARRAHNLELYGSRSRRMRLRRVIGATLSDIGVIANSSVQGPLLRLAADNDETVQRVAARALARWREFSRDAQLFETLHRWRTDSRQIEDVLLQDNESPQRDQLHARVRATIALTVRYAALYDAPNMLAADLCQLIEQLALDHHPTVRSRFVQYTLPLLVQLHGACLRDSLGRMTQQRDLMHPVAASLAAAYRRNPDEVLQTLAVWHNTCARHQPAEDPQQRVGPREKLLATIAYTYGEIQYMGTGGLLTADEIFARLRLILDTEQHPFIRNAVVVAMARQARQQFEAVEPMLRSIMAAVAEGEHPQIVQILTSIYLEQREQLSGGDGYIELIGRSYAIWIDSEQRPPTAIEHAMNRWVKQPQPVEAQQIATQALVAFVRTLDLAERRRAAQILEERQQNPLIATAPTAIQTAPTIVRQPSTNTFGSRLLVWFITLGFARTYRSIVRGLLSEVRIQNRVNKEALRVVVGRWRRSADQEIRTLGAILARALLFMR